VSAPTTIRRLLVANRGEIARRVLATCRRLGIETVAVHGDPDAGEPFVREADLAVPLGGAAAADSYLRGDAVIAAARAAGADAIHPGYGFLSEDAAFAAAVRDAGLRWVGPDPETIAAMGSKVRARDLMADAGVPVLPGARVADDATPQQLAEQAAGVGFPLLVKASAGGGGRGMRRVDEPGALVDAVTAARREAASAFGDGTVFLERYVLRPRHVEVQILGDAHGTISVLPERDCTVQRRHQKLVEESPAPALDGAVRASLADAARRAGQAIGYRGAGTVEFVLAGGDGALQEAFFLEVNTRLQVEHPVTELVTGLDLVELQLRIAEGEPLPPEALDPAPRGHAIEARIVAEDPAAGWRPQTGVVERFALAGASAFATAADGAAGGRTAMLRLDAAVEPGSVVSPHYDSMLAKAIVHAPTRDAALRRLADGLRRAEIVGPLTARDLLVRVLEHPDVAAVRHDTQWLDGAALEELARPLVVGEDLRAAAAAAALADDAARRGPSAPRAATLAPAGWRNVPAHPQRVAFDVAVGDASSLEAGGAPAGRDRSVASSGPEAGPDGEAGRAGADPGLVVEHRLDRDGALAALRVGGAPLDAELVAAGPGAVVLRVGRERVAHRFDVVVAADGTRWVRGLAGWAALRPRPRFADPDAADAAGSLTAPLPGVVLRVLAAVGDEVAAGQPLVVVEAMKMEHEIAAPAAGRIAELPVAAGEQVEAGRVLAVLDEA